MKWKSGFYFNDEAPENAVLLTKEEYESLLEGQRQGLTIEDENGKPVLKDYRINADIINNKKLNSKYIPSELDSMRVFAKLYLKSNTPKNTEEKMLLSGLYETWELGKYEIGDIRNYAGQTWECHQAHDNATYPDIKPDNAQTWATFWKPLHGTSKETARPWCKPINGTTDIYHIGEYMIWTDGSIKKCLRDTNYSPEEYPADWEDVA